MWTERGVCASFIFHSLNVTTTLLRIFRVPRAEILYTLVLCNFRLEKKISGSLRPIEVEKKRESACAIYDGDRSINAIKKLLNEGWDGWERGGKNVKERRQWYASKGREGDSRVSHVRSFVRSFVAAPKERVN